jgi:exodeoxyribonuclease V alpha subunit
MNLDDTQSKAVDACVDVNKRVVAVTGQAGTGKTTIMRIVHERLSSVEKKVVLCAPTGKAAKRIQEATGIPAMTIHRLLEYPHPGEVNPKTGKHYISTDPKRDAYNPIEFDVVLADEYAMVNTELHRNLLDSLPSGGIIRMFGDANQLPPIEASKLITESPFVSMLKKFDGIRLTTIHRQAEGSSIIENGDRIVRGVTPKRTNEFEITITETPVEAVSDVVMNDLASFCGVDNQIISPTRQGWIGTYSLNEHLQTLIQDPTKASLELERHRWAKQDNLRLFIGDKVINTVNNYGIEVFNGESGVVTGFDDARGVTIDFGDRVVTVPEAMPVTTRRGIAIINPQKDLELAYVITTHKAQGSEYEKVIYVMNRSRSWGLSRKNLYTGISRARKQVKLITDSRSLSLSLYKQG